MAEDIQKEVDVQSLLEAVLAGAIKSYFKELPYHDKLQKEVGDKICKTQTDQEKMRRLVEFNSARRFIFDESGYQSIIDMAGSDYPLPSVGEIRRCCNDIEYLKRTYPNNPYLPGQTTAQRRQDDNEYESTLPFRWQEYIEWPIRLTNSLSHANKVTRRNNGPVVVVPDSVGHIPSGT
jgi:hypothetical protein